MSVSCKVKPCKHCSSTTHFSFQCYTQRKPIKHKGKRTIAYEKWRDEVAKPYLDKTFGHVCSGCPATENLDVDHIKTRGSRADLKMNLTNVQYLCRNCHRKKTDHLEEK